MWCCWISPDDNRLLGQVVKGEWPGLGQASWWALLVLAGLGSAGGK